MPNTNHNKCHKCNGAGVSEDIDEYLEDWLTNTAVDRGSKVLDGKE